ncbi:unnamed protein product [Notodromas monacha]|uniref:Cadherin domain-containing protein n=1 Tax=Notodromas monacha TaxID=399045 RepID=A0A7R9GBE5_9CRUS|nr:unnamed protein product [Notodromas monacha]CAG0916276.1 unnamed protein product [Notodromas monacha]
MTKYPAASSTGEGFLVGLGSGGNSGEEFMVGRDTGSIFLAKQLDWETQREYNLSIRVSDGLFDSVAQILVIVTDTNDNRPEFTERVFEAEISESTPIGSSVIQVSAFDRDEDQRVFYSIHSVQHRSSADLFKIDSTRGLIATSGVLDREAIQKHLLTVMVKDHGNPSLRNFARVRITVKDANDHGPEFLESLIKGTVFESADVGTSVLQVMAFDKDHGENARLTYSIVAGNVGNAFRVDSTLGIISTAKDLDRSRMPEYMLVVQATDSGTPPLSARLHVQILVTVADSAPPKFKHGEYSAEIEENQQPGTFVTSVTARSKSSLYYEIVSGNERKIFAINPSSGVVFIVGRLDYEEGNFFNLTIQAWNTKAGKPGQTAALLLNGGICFTGLFKHGEYSAEIEENQQPGTFVTSVTARSKSSLYYEIVSGNERKIFAINPSSGVVFIVGRLDYEEGNFFNLTIQAWNTMRASSSTLLLVSVLDQNDNFPQFVRSVYEGYVRESASVGSMVLTNSSTPLVVKAVDKDRGLNALLRYDMVENGPENRLFSVDTNTGAVKTKGILDFETMPVVEFKIRVSDSGTPSLRADTVAIVRVHVEDVNDTPPQFDSLFYNATLHLPTYKGVAVAQLNASDPDSSRDSLRFELVHGNEDGAFVLDPVSGLLSIANPGVLDKTHELQVSVSDGKYSGATVVRINCETSLDSGLRFEMDRYEASVEENSTRILIVEIVNLLGLRLNEHVEFRILNPSELFEIGLTSGAIRTCGIPFDRELQEKYEIIIEAVSDAGEYGRRVAHALVEVTVTDINDNRPMFLNLPYYTVMSVSSEQGDVVIQLEAIDLDTGENGRIRYDLVRGEGEIFRVEPRTGKVVLKRALGSDRTSYDILVAAYDGGKVPMFAETTVHIKVMDRLMPVFNKQFFNATVPENAEPYTAVINVVAESPQGRKLIYGISRGNEYEEFGFDFNTGSIFVGDALDYELKSEYELYLRASDSVSGAYSEVPVNIRVTDVNDNPPVFSKLSYEASVSELRAVGAEILKVQASDRDEGMNGAIRYSLEDISLDANSTTWFRVNPITGLITLSRPLDHERMPVHRIFPPKHT